MTERIEIVSILFSRINKIVIWCALKTNISLLDHFVSKSMVFFYILYNLLFGINNLTNLKS